MERLLLFRATEGPKVGGVADAALELERVNGIPNALMFTIIDGGMQMVFIDKADCLKLARTLNLYAKQLTA